MKLRVSEIFTSIQGEGIWAGIPSTFIRLSGCNLRCAWCDTPYASWEPEGPMMELSAIVAQVAASHVVITGGEPMLFDGLGELCRMIKSGTHSSSFEGTTPPPSSRSASLPLHPHHSPGSGGEGASITIETAGTRFLDLPCDLMSISPKLTNSIPKGGKYIGPAVVRDIDPTWEQRHDTERLQPGILRQLIRAYNYQLKFVVTQPSDITEIEALLSEIGPVEPSRVILMPEGVTSEKLHAGASALVPICLAKGWRLGPRMHIDLFGDTKGT